MQLLEIITLTTTILKCSLASTLVAFHSNETPHFSESVHGVGEFYYQADRSCAPSASPSIVELPSTSPTPVPSHPFDTHVVTDCIIDNRAVICHHCGTIGHLNVPPLLLTQTCQLYFFCLSQPRPLPQWNPQSLSRQHQMWCFHWNHVVQIAR